MRKEFISVFKITNMIMFQVNYYTLGNNDSPYFSTSAMKFTRNKRDFERCGQCQDDLLVKGIAKEFYRKWDNKHISDLNDVEYSDLMCDMEQLKSAYEHIYIEKDTFKNQNSNISFYAIKELSMNKKHTA